LISVIGRARARARGAWCTGGVARAVPGCPARCSMTWCYSRLRQRRRHTYVVARQQRTPLQFPAHLRANAPVHSATTHGGTLNRTRTQALAQALVLPHATDVAGPCFDGRQMSHVWSRLVSAPAPAPWWCASVGLCCHSAAAVVQRRSQRQGSPGGGLDAGAFRASTCTSRSAMRWGYVVGMCCVVRVVSWCRCSCSCT
jgi:hypothetical protein